MLVTGFIYFSLDEPNAFTDYSTDSPLADACHPSSAGPHAWQTMPAPIAISFYFILIILFMSVCHNSTFLVCITTLDNEVFSDFAL